MNILGVETSTTMGSVAILSESGLVAQYSLNIQATHSERFMSTLDRALKDADLTVSDIDGFGVSIGPGSFTGLRIGLAAVKGFAFATGKPAAAVPTLKALAWNLPYCEYYICPLLDARKNEVYAALYKFSGADLEQMMPESAVSLAKLAEQIPEKTVFTGEAARLYRSEIQRLLGDRAFFAPLSSCFPSAASVAEIALDMIKNGKLADLDGLAPMYIRRPEAEVAWEKRMRSK